MKVKLSSLVPTQSSVGIHQVQMKAKKIQNMKDHVVKQYLHDRPVPVVTDRNGKFYLIDRHHLCSACILIDIKKVKIILVADFSDTKNDEEFWDRMYENKYVLLQDSHGILITYDMLPKTLKELSNDPYRSLAGLVRDAGIIKKVNIPFSEFTWAAFFRKHFEEEVVNEMISDKTEQHSSQLSSFKTAIRLAQSDYAKDIPGYIGKGVPH
jgi:hypothetical protein